MAIIIQTDNPEDLLDKIYEAIENKKADKWAVTADGKLTYGTLLWKNEGFFKPEIWVEENELRFGLIKRKDRRYMSSKLYTAFHSKLIETLLRYFDKDFRNITVTATRTDPDVF